MNRKFMEAALRSKIDRALKNDLPKMPKLTYRGMNQKFPSLDSGSGNATKSDKPTYTGTAMIGIATMHKSNAVPVFSKDAAIETAGMRR